MSDNERTINKIEPGALELVNTWLKDREEFFFVVDRDAIWITNKEPEVFKELCLTNVADNSEFMDLYYATVEQSVENADMVPLVIRLTTTGYHILDKDVQDE